VTDVTPTRSAVLELKDERHAMREGYDFLDEKCMLLAGEMLRELAHHDSLQRAFLESHAEAVTALRAALGRHGLQGLEVCPAAELSEAEVPKTSRLLMGVRLQEAELHTGDTTPKSAVNPSPEAMHCRRAFLELLTQAATLAAVSGNLERLYLEYRRAARRARALQDVLLPELEHTLAEIEARLDELEQEDALGMRRNVTAALP
jgi:V/A-type H+/Na+-transporting ATPase subunit D